MTCLCASGPVDRFGYCEAEVGGRTGLVPASHLYPLTDNAATYRPASQPHGRHKVSSLCPEGPADT